MFILIENCVTLALLKSIQNGNFDLLEATHMYAMRTYFFFFKYVPSTRNQEIECQWSHFRRQRLSWWINFFHDLNESASLYLTSEIHKEALWFCFADQLQADLDKVKEYWNSHHITKSSHATVLGVLDMMYFFA